MLTLFFSPLAFAGPDSQIYSKAVKLARSQQQDFAFMQFNRILRDFPKSKFREPALFACGEYYFDILNYQESNNLFNTLLNEFPNSKSKIFILAYLLKIAQAQRDEVLAKNLEQEIISSQKVGLVFKDYQEYKIKSPQNRWHKVIFRINKIEFFINENLFIEISY